MIQKIKLTYVIAQTLLLVFKTTSLVTWSWWLILLPTLILIGIVAIYIIAFTAMVVLALILKLLE